MGFLGGGGSFYISVGGGGPAGIFPVSGVFRFNLPGVYFLFLGSVIKSL